MKLLKMFGLSLSLIVGALFSPFVFAAETVTDGEAINVIVSMFDGVDSAGGSVGIGIVILSAIMTLLKWERLGKLFEVIPKKYRSFVPIVLGSLIGILQAIANGDAGSGVLLTEFLKGGVLIGGLQQAVYQQFKGTKPGDLLKKLVKT